MMIAFLKGFFFSLFVIIVFTLLKTYIPVPKRIATAEESFNNAYSVKEIFSVTIDANTVFSISEEDLRTMDRDELTGLVTLYQLSREMSPDKETFFHLVKILLPRFYKQN